MASKKPSFSAQPTVSSCRPLKFTMNDAPRAAVRAASESSFMSVYMGSPSDDGRLLATVPQRRFTIGRY